MMKINNKNVEVIYNNYAKIYNKNLKEMGDWSGKLTFKQINIYMFMTLFKRERAIFYWKRVCDGMVIQLAFKYTREYKYKEIVDFLKTNTNIYDKN